MSYWRFKNILESLKKKMCLENGKPYIEHGLSRSTKDMIEKRKAQRPK